MASLLAACVVPTPEIIVVTSVITTTPRPTYTPYPTYTALPTYTPYPTPTPTSTPRPTRTPTSTPTTEMTPTVTATSTRRAAAAVTQPSPTATATATPALAGPSGSGPLTVHGVTATFRLDTRRRTFAPNEKIWFRFAIRNDAATVLPYGFIGVKIGNGGFHTSWTGASIAPNGTLNWRDNVTLAAPGTYILTLAMCFSTVEACRGGSGDWADLSTGIQVTIQ